jgi:hypothetical protein
LLARYRQMARDSKIFRSPSSYAGTLANGWCSST